MKIIKDFTFELAHKLMRGRSYSTKCQNIHGHSYKLRLAFERMDGQLNEDGMVIDFGYISDTLGDYIKQFDHALMICKDDCLYEAIRAHLCENSQKLIVTNFNPTSENLATFLFDKLTEKLKGEAFRLCEVYINETCSSQAVVNNAYTAALECEFIAGN